MHNLTREQVELFNRVHRMHLNAMGTEAQVKRTLEHVKSVTWHSEGVLKVVYDDGEWWHYRKGGTWD